MVRRYGLGVFGGGGGGGIAILYQTTWLEGVAFWGVFTIWVGLGILLLTQWKLCQSCYHEADSSLASLSIVLLHYLKTRPEQM